MKAGCQPPTNQVVDKACGPLWTQAKVVGMSCGYEASRVEDLIIQSCRGCRDAMGSAGLVVTVAGGVVGGDGEGARVLDDFEGVAAVGGIDAHLLRGIGRGPYLRGGDDGAFGGVGATGAQ